MTDDDIRDLVEASSLGTPGARRLRDRTTAEQRTAVAQRADRYAAALTAEARAAMKHLEAAAAKLPEDGPPPVRLAYQKARQAVGAARGALEVDPTLAAPDRERDLAVLAEVLRQIKPLGRQAEAQLERDRLAPLRGLPGIDERIARLGYVNRHAIGDLTALAGRAVEIAAQLTKAALPDWESPERVRERSARLLPSPGRLEQIAEELRYAVRHALHVPYPDPDAVRLAAVADLIPTPPDDLPPQDIRDMVEAAALRRIEPLEQELHTARTAATEAAEERCRSDLAAALKTRGPQTWGALIDAAGLVGELLDAHAGLLNVLDDWADGELTAVQALVVLRDKVAREIPDGDAPAAGPADDDGSGDGAAGAPDG